MVDAPISDPASVALRTRFRRTERITATVVLAVSGPLLVAAIAIPAATGATIDLQFVLLGLGLGLISGNLLFTIRNASDEVPWARDRRALPVRAVRRALLSGDEPDRDSEQIRAAARWAAQESLHLRASVISSILVVAGISGLVVVPQLMSRPPGPLWWAMAATFGCLLTLCVPMTIRQRRLDRFATRMGVWGATGRAIHPETVSENTGR